MSRAPGEGDIVYPGAGVIPAADVETDSLTSSFLYGIGNGGIAFLLIKDTAPFLTHASAEVHLYEVEAELVEEEVTVLMVMTVQPDTQAQRVLVVIAAASVVSTVGVDSGFKSETVVLSRPPK